MSKKLTKKDKEKLQSLIDDVMFEAKKVTSDYEENPSEISGSVVHIHEKSPFLSDSEVLKGDKWKKIITSDYLYSKLEKKSDKKA